MTSTIEHLIYLLVIIGIMIPFVVLLIRYKKERDLFESEFKEISRKADSLLLSKTTFLANMAHELRTPLSGIIGMGQFILDGEEDSHKKKNIRAVVDSANILANSINTILDFANLESNKFELDFTIFDMKEMFSEVENIFKVRAKNCEIEFFAKVDSDLPKDLIGDEVRLKQVIVNLCGNSLKFTKEGHITIGARLIKQGESSATVKFIVRDTGVGLTKKQHADLLSSSVLPLVENLHDYSNSALTLNMSKRLIEYMGGRISVDGCDQSGTCFSFELELDISSKLKKLEKGPEYVISGNERVLIVEDDKLNQEIALRMLSNMGVTHIDIASNGIEALELYDQSMFDLIFMDCLMPELDGYEATQEIRKRELSSGRYTPVIAFTANALKDGIEKCYNVGMDLHCLKPVRSTTLEDLALKGFELGRKAKENL